MSRFTIFILITLSLTILSCGSRRARLDRRNLIPEKELVSILTDIYLTDGIIGMPRLAVKYPPLDSASTYNNVIQKHGYTREALDKSIKYYFIKDPKKLIKIYDKVLGILSEMESRVQKDISKTKPRTGTIWPGLESYYFPDPSGKDSTQFKISLTKPGLYTLTATVILFPDDQSLNPGFSAFTFNPDSIETGKRKYIGPVYYIKDGMEHKYDITFTVPIKSTLDVSGSLYDYLNNPSDWEKHIIIKNIYVTYSMVAK